MGVHDRSRNIEPEIKQGDAQQDAEQAEQTGFNHQQTNDSARTCPDGAQDRHLARSLSADKVIVVRPRSAATTTIAEIMISAGVDVGAGVIDAAKKLARSPGRADRRRRTLKSPELASRASYRVREAADQGASIDPGDRRDALTCEPVAQRARRSVMTSWAADRMLHDEALNLDLARS